MKLGLYYEVPLLTSRDRAVVARQFHKLKVVGSNPTLRN